MKNLAVILIAVVLTSCGQDKETMKETGTEGSPEVTAPYLTTSNENSQVTNEYGALTVQAGEFTGDTKIIPWSSWWFPTKDKFLFESAAPGELAPLQKYDLFVERSDGLSAESAFFEENKIYNPSEVNWAGLCHAWAVAAILRPEPKNNLIKKDIVFNVADQKALMLKSYENAEGLKFYGSRYNGFFNDDFGDVYPDQFHRFAQVHLFEKHLPFLMDYDPSFPVWTAPIYQIKFHIAKADATSAHVKAWVTMATPFVDSPNFIGTKKSVKYYEYKLYGKWDGENLNVTGAEWVNDSQFDHPDYLIAYPNAIKRSSHNEKLDIVKIDEILGQKN